MDMDTEVHPIKTALVTVLEYIYLAIPASEFRRPVCSIFPNIAADYLKVIRSPEDLGTILHDALTLHLPLDGRTAADYTSKVLDQFRTRLQRVFENAIKYNGVESPYMISISDHMSIFCRSLWEEILVSAYYKEDEVNFKSLRLMRRHHRFCLVKNMRLNYFEYQEMKKVLDSVKAFAVSNVMLRSVLESLIDSEDNSFCRNPQNRCVTLIDYLIPIFQCLFPSRDIPELFDNNDNKTSAKPKYSFSSLFDGIPDEEINAKNMFLQYFDEQLGPLLCLLTERHFRGTQLSSIYLRFYKLLWSKVPVGHGPDKSKTHYWVAAVIAENRKTDDGDKINELSISNIKRLPDYTLTSLKKLRPKQNNISGGLDSSSSASDGPVCSLQSVGSSSSDNSNLSPAPRGFQIPAGYAVVEYLSTHEIGWVKLDSTLPYIDESNVDLSTLDPIFTPVETELGTVYAPNPMGCDMETVKEAQEAKLWINSVSPVCCAAVTGSSKFVKLEEDSLAFADILSNRDPKLMSLPSVEEISESIKVDPTILQKSMKANAGSSRSAAVASAAAAKAAAAALKAPPAAAPKVRGSQAPVPRPTVNFADGKPKFTDIKMPASIKDSQFRRRAVYRTQLYSMWLNSTQCFTDNKEAIPVTVRLPGANTKDITKSADSTHSSILDSIAKGLPVAGQKRKADDEAGLIAFDAEEPPAAAPAENEKKTSALSGLSTSASIKCISGNTTKWVKGEGLIHLRTVDEFADIFCLENSSRRARKESLRKELALIQEKLKKLNVKPETQKKTPRGPKPVGQGESHVSSVPMRPSIMNTGYQSVLGSEPKPETTLRPNVSSLPGRVGLLAKLKKMNS